MKFILKGPTDNKSALVQTMAWRQIGKTPLLESMLTQFTDAYIGHYVVTVDIVNEIICIFIEIHCIWLNWGYISDKSTLVQAMACCRYLDQ